MSDEIYQERRRIAFRLCGFFIPISEIAIGTGLSEDEVFELHHMRSDFIIRKQAENPYYYFKKYWELDDIEKEIE